MPRSRVSIAYDILHGIHFASNNVSTIFAYLNYFPPPPPVIPSPPAQRSWTCSHPSYTSSCLISDDLNPPDFRQYVPFNDKNQSFLSINSSHVSKSTHQTPTSLSIINFVSNHFTFLLLFIIFLSLFISVILVILLIIYIRRSRRQQRRLTSTHHHHEINNNNNNNNTELNKTNEKDKKFYYHLIPYQQKQTKHLLTTLRQSHDGNMVIRLSNHDSPVLEVKRLSKTSGSNTNNIEEHEEAL